MYSETVSREEDFLSNSAIWFYCCKKRKYSMSNSEGRRNKSNNNVPPVSYNSENDSVEINTSLDKKVNSSDEQMTGNPKEQNRKRHFGGNNSVNSKKQNMSEPQDQTMDRDDNDSENIEASYDFPCICEASRTTSPIPSFNNPRSRKHVKNEIAEAMKEHETNNQVTDNNVMDKNTLPEVPKPQNFSASENLELENIIKTLQKQLEKEKKNYEIDLKNLQSVVEQKNKEIEKKNNEIQRQRAELQIVSDELQMKIVEIMNMKSDISALKQNNAHLTQQLAVEWSSKISKDESSVENVTIKNRPMNIAAEMTQLMSNQWLDLKLQLDDQEWNEELKQKFLFNILLISEKSANEHFDDLIQSVHLTMAEKTGQCTKPSTETPRGKDDGEAMEWEQSDAQVSTIVKATTEEIRVNAHQPKLELLKNSVADFLRKEADSFDASPVAQRVNTELEKNSELGPVYNIMREDESFGEYIKACCLLSWKMVIQKPIMYFQYQGINEQMNPQLHEPDYTSDDPNHPQAVIQYFVSPNLFHGKQAMCKAKVHVKQITNQSQN